MVWATIAAASEADDVAVFRQADQQRAALSGGDERVGLAVAHHGDRVRAGDLVERRTHRRLEVALVHLGDQLGEHLGVGVAGKRSALAGEIGAEGGVVFDGAVVDEDDPLAVGGLGGVGVCVLLGDLAVGGPAGVGDAGPAVAGLWVSGLIRQHLFEDADASDAACDADAGGRLHRDSRRVVAAIFQPLEPLNQEGRSFVWSDVSDNATHTQFPFHAPHVTPWGSLATRTRGRGGVEFIT